MTVLCVWSKVQYLVSSSLWFLNDLIQNASYSWGVVDILLVLSFINVTVVVKWLCITILLISSAMCLFIMFNNVRPGNAPYI